MAVTPKGVSTPNFQAWGEVDWQKWQSVLTGTVSIGYRKIGTQELTPVAVAAGKVEEQSFTVSGLEVGDIVVVNKPSFQTDLGIVGCRVSANDELSIAYVNMSGGPITPTKETYLIIGHRSS